MKKRLKGVKKVKARVEYFAKKHKKELIIGGCMVATGVVGWKLSERRFKEAVFLDDRITDLLIDAQEYGSETFYIAGVDPDYIGAPVADYFGEFSKDMLEGGVPKDSVVTHIVGFIKEKEDKK